MKGAEVIGVVAGLIALVVVMVWCFQWAWTTVAVTKFGAPSFDFVESCAAVCLLSFLHHLSSTRKAAK